MDFKNIPKKYRSIPFWSWNEKLCTEETREQVQAMNDAGIGGYFMHARGGLQTEYMSEEWFENVEAAIDEGNKCGMYTWAYDENGWPSGFGNGKVNALGVEYQQKYLRMESTPEHKETAICKNGEHYFYYEINPFYVDTLDEKVIKEFIESTYEEYYERFGEKIEGFFTDEPQISRNGIPWSFVYEKEYKSRYNENINEHLEELFLPVGDYRKTRIKFWKMVTDLFSSAFMKQIYDWCDEHNYKLTGHLVLEESTLSQVVSNGACMPHYEYFHIPGMDWLTRNIFECLTVYQLTSAAEQLGKKAVLTESFACCGHNASFAELKGIYEWQMVRGVNLLCQHLEGYSIRGIRKRDYPPAMYRQQPWWSEYKTWNDAMSRISMILQESKRIIDVLLLHPQTTAWTLYDDNKNEGIEELNRKFLNTIKALEEKHINFHLGDETLMERHAEIKNGKLVIGKQSYSYIIDSGCEYLLPNTKKLIEEFTVQGGKIVNAADLAENNVVDDKTITYCERYADGFKIHYFVNTSAETKKAKINVRGRKLEIYSGDLLDFDGVHEFEPWGSLLIIEDGSDNAEYVEEETTSIYPDGEFKVADALNAITLDRCDYYFDGVLQENNGYVLNVCERANALEKRVQIHMDYHVVINDIPEMLYLVSETPEKFEIKINDIPLKQKIEGYYCDKSFKKIDIKDYVKTGKNVISFDCDFYQSEEFYQNLKKARVFESEKNKLVYETEIEAIYLLGNFSVTAKGEWTEIDKNALRYKGDFEIDAPVESIVLKNIERQGFTFFCGEMVLEGEIDIKGTNPVLELNQTGINAIKVEIGDFKKTILTDRKISLKELEGSGKQKIKLTLINNLRNLLGPHHLKEGEIYHVGPYAFFKEKCIWNSNPEDLWDDDYCFVKMGLN